MDLNTLQITPQILKLIAEIDEFKGSWRALGTLAPERLAALRKVATIESIGSSTRIEGAKLSDRQIETLLSNLDSLSFTTRDERVQRSLASYADAGSAQEVAGYADVMQILFESWEMIPITENYIKQLHSILLQYSHKDERHRGNYKAVDNHIEAFNQDGQSLGILFTTASPMMTPLLMEELVNWTRDAFTDKQLHPLLITGIFIVRFLAIHPFQDGNERGGRCFASSLSNRAVGRLSRVLTTLLLLKSGYTYVPFSSLETVIEENKDSYYLALRRTQQSLKTDTPDWNSWLLFFLHSLKRQKDRLAVKLEREKIMQSSLPELSVKILELAKEHGTKALAACITTGEIERYTQANRSTIKARINDLLGMKKLIRHGKGRSTWYSLF